MNARASLWVDLVASVLGAPERVRSHCLPKGESGGEPLRRYLAEPKLFPCPLQPRSPPFALVGDLLVCAVKINFTARCRGGLFYVLIQCVKHIPLFLFQSYPILRLFSFLFCLRNIIRSFCLLSSFLHSLLVCSGSPKQPYPLISQPRWRFRFIPLSAVFMFSCPCSHACLVRLLCIMHCTHTKVFIYHYHHCQGRVRVHSMAMKRRRVFPVSSSFSFVPHRWGVSSWAVFMVL